MEKSSTNFSGYGKKKFLLNYTGAISENNYIDRANDFEQQDGFVDHIRAIEKVEKFIKTTCRR